MTYLISLPAPLVSQLQILITHKGIPGGEHLAARIEIPARVLILYQLVA
ncbi:hypothetical protein ACP_0876 [Acidobacterium capsulatum ATCC 51196]|uniref:Uncharacterized protein n=1 Tax=Acidobacterium capsulatum (strain ATCC 51196 / DSM 11244 / BCRC 80197 / JCM 7670 / NBRC 15755 / NCIMB 13165 / 161) TaxID=240015 RepID=C1F2X4_ACIC5|nr:hypothetical protein ACP_0876 [Acidobacterium capsulatum ATCC 51196]